MATTVDIQELDDLVPFRRGSLGWHVGRWVLARNGAEFTRTQCAEGLSTTPDRVTKVINVLRAGEQPQPNGKRRTFPAWNFEVTKGTGHGHNPEWLRLVDIDGEKPPAVHGYQPVQVEDKRRNGGTQWKAHKQTPRNVDLGGRYTLVSLQIVDDEVMAVFEHEDGGEMRAVVR